MSVAPVVLANRCAGLGTQPISYFMQQAVENPGLITLAAGLVDPFSLPTTEVREALDALLGDSARAQAALQYGATQGYGTLREQLLAHCTQLDGVKPADVSLSADEIVLTTGSQQLLYLLTELLCDPGDIVLTEIPTYFVYLGVLETLGVRALGVPTDAEGMDIDALEELLVQLEQRGERSRLRLIYTCDYFQNPSGLTLSLSRRARLLELARRYSRERRIFILEDAPYRELRYDGPDLPSIKSLDHDNSQVILAMSFSKTLSPGLKTGYGLLPRELIQPLVTLKGSHDFGSCNLSQHLLAHLLANGAYGRHVQVVCQFYKHKRDAMLAALAEHFQPWPEVTWTNPGGGLYIWVTFPPGIETSPGSRLLQAALREGVLYVPGIFCSPRESCGGVSERSMRLTYATASVEQIQEAIARLARAAAPLLGQWA